MGGIAAGAIKATYQKHREVWNDVANKELAKAHLLSDGTFFLLCDIPLLDYPGDAGTLISGAIAVGIHSLEIYNGCGHPTLASDKSEEAEKLKIIDVLEGCERSVLQFYSKRIPCACLDNRYAAAKSKPKTGVCSHCQQRKQRSKLMVCSRCKFQQYCSKECQMASWQDHKEDCKNLSADP